MSGRIITKDNPTPKLPTDEVRMPKQITWQQMVAVLVEKFAKDDEVILAPKDFNAFMDNTRVLMNAVSQEGITLKVIDRADAEKLMKEHEGSKQ